ncbi:hypothetical protein STCU_00646 [Strigomonas culicis]|uniref:DNA-directed RNA polymerase II subunit RPB4 n=1 Tax=Strigomonas culicis TaxID=28005 RepID=S9UZM7_9TRYP|nr:hypothetical protein STCU_02866 [Strigomonas culicis]EPY36317.1 hypothetical protein STCU_00646 [Strigomonas culicis]|eukprot:EPY32328.1 hypothetical protein STCU_02866 [Strigomonas culicis]
MAENYSEGDLGIIFRQAEPLTLPMVSQLLRDIRAGSDGGSTAAEALLHQCREEVEVIQETCAPEDAVAHLAKERLRRRGPAGGDEANAHLAHIAVDAEGNVVSDGTADATPAAPSLSREPMKPFEVVALATLVPRTAEEAIVLVPSLHRFEANDLQNALAILQ